MGQKILVVEDSRVLANLIKKRLQSELPVSVVLAESLQETQDLLESKTDYSDFLMAILDLHLPDAIHGEVVDYVTGKDIPSVILTGTFNERLRNELFSKNIIDYLIKEGARDLDLIVRTVRRLIRNAESKVLVVDDSRFSRHYMSKLLRRQHYQVMTTSNGEEALKVIADEPDIKLVITDYNMPGMSGYDLIGELRKKHGPEKLGIIGVSASDEESLTARLLKFGANDFIKKPFGVEEFYCRVNQNLEIINLVEEIQEASNTDYLTRLHNRRFFFETAPRLLKRANREGNPFALAMMDIDHFKKINDTHGHDKGDLALVNAARFIKENLRPTDLVCRFGGEEFCVLMVDVNPEDALARLEHVRSGIETLVVDPEGSAFGMTLSIGVAFNQGLSLEEMIKLADLRLYEAKKSGRNRIIGQEPAA